MLSSRCRVGALAAGRSSCSVSISSSAHARRSTALGSRPFGSTTTEPDRGGGAGPRRERRPPLAPPPTPPAREGNDDDLAAAALQARERDRFRRHLARLAWPERRRLGGGLALLVGSSAVSVGLLAARGHGSYPQLSRRPILTHITHSSSRQVVFPRAVGAVMDACLLDAAAG